MSMSMAAALAIPTSLDLAGAKAGDLRVFSSNHIRVRAPAGTFGSAAITIENELFPGEQTLAPVEYFYSNRETGSVDLAQDSL